MKRERSSLSSPSKTTSSTAKKAISPLNAEKTFASVPRLKRFRPSIGHPRLPRRCGELTTSRSPSRSKRVAPRFVELMQCKPVTALPNEGNWTFEIKFDGYRCLAVKNHGDVKVFSRNENVLDARFPSIAEALKAIPGDFAIDGEIVALDDQGCPSFQLLQNSRPPQVAVYFYAFDLLNFDGEDLRASPIERRRQLLNKLLHEPADPLRLSPLFEATGPRVLEAVRELGLEG